MELKPLFFAALLGLPFTSAFAAVPALKVITI